MSDLGDIDSSALDNLLEICRKHGVKRFARDKGGLEVEFYDRAAPAAAPAETSPADLERAMAELEADQRQLQFAASGMVPLDIRRGRR